MKQNCKRQAKKNSGLKKVIKRKGDRLTVKLKGYDNSLNSLINIKRYSIRMSQYFPALHERSDGNVKVELDLSNYAAKADLKGATGIDTYTLTAKTDLVSLKI